MHASTLLELYSYGVSTASRSSYLCRRRQRLILVCMTCRFQGLDGQVSEFELKPNWCLPLQEVHEEWDINPATEDLPLDQVLAAAAAVRHEHLAGWALHVAYLDVCMPSCTR